MWKIRKYIPIIIYIVYVFCKYFVLLEKQLCFFVLRLRTIHGNFHVVHGLCTPYQKNISSIFSTIFFVEAQYRKVTLIQFFTNTIKYIFTHNTKHFLIYMCTTYNVQLCWCVYKKKKKVLCTNLYMLLIYFHLENLLSW